MISYRFGAYTNAKLATIMFFVLLGCRRSGGRQLDVNTGSSAARRPPIILCVRNTCDHHTCWCCISQFPGDHCYDNLDDCRKVCPHPPTPSLPMAQQTMI
ncbi:uncharacterized protein [Aegilops tauschii subsp. strangulata]|uniref:uncharacterized protein n=1 Tax=Aegilops tauschii subsp. strangulata TaxID=200361 RepID=UPI001ABC7CA7|nr:uncharacterized protein LOC120965949 [Aegilops tauschii subsp. strangulata]